MKARLTTVFLFLISTHFGQITNLRAGLWSDGTLWSGAVVPGINDSVSLDYDIVIDMFANCRMLNANRHNVTINPGFNLNVVGNNEPPDSTFTDVRDGQVYSFRHIGTQVWMTKNLNYAAATSWCYNNDTANCGVYGRLYDWNTALTVAPVGWHLPSQAEWETLIYFIDDRFVAGDKMKEAGYAHWQYNIYGGVATNSSGFTALPGGDIEFGTVTAFYGIGQNSYFWSSTSLWPLYAWACLMQKHTSVVTTFDFYGSWKQNGYSVRCVRDY